MTKTKKGLSLTAGIALAMVFTFSCSGDDGGDGGGGSNLSDLPKEVYSTAYDDDYNLTKQGKYEGNGDIFALMSNYISFSCGPVNDPGVNDPGVCKCTSFEGVVSSCKEEDIYDTLPAGKIQGGQLQLNLPANVNSKYFQKMEPCDSERCQISVVPANLLENLLIYNHSPRLRVAISDRSDCSIGYGLRLLAYQISSGKTDRTQFWYLSESGKITGTETGDGYQTNIDISFSKGWNLVYIDNYDNYTNVTTDFPKGGTLEWWLECSDY